VETDPSDPPQVTLTMADLLTIAGLNVCPPVYAADEAAGASRAGWSFFVRRRLTHG
jgi:hypothetical protein